MSEAELATFRGHTARSAPRPGGYTETVAIVGRQSGKTRLAAAIATFEAISAEREPGSDLFAVLVAQDQRAALRTSFRYAAAPFEASAMLRHSIVSQTADIVALETGVTLAAYPCRPAAVRGLRARVVVVDEVAFSPPPMDARPTLKCFALFVRRWRPRAES